MKAQLSVFLFVSVMGFATGVVAAPVERQLRIRLDVEATQDWKNDPQWGKANSQQHYDIATTLRSDGKLYVENLLDPDRARRMKIKSDWYLYQGLSELKAENGGKLPPAGQGRVELSAESLAMSGGMASPQMANASPQRLTAQQALRDRSIEDLEAFMRQYDQPGGRWMYFEGFSGCASQLQIQYHSKFVGDIARKAGNKAPFDMQWDADVRAPASDGQPLCKRYVVTYAPSTDTLIVENVYLPPPRGTSVRKEFGRTERREVDLPAPYEVARWADDALKQSRSAGTLSATLPLNAALDGKDAALGEFRGTGKVALEWSFR